jgi:uncharacterized protein YlxW (UPF0749 family)
MVVAIVALVMFATIAKAWIESRSRASAEPEDSAEKARLREEVKQLKDRLQVLERIAVDKENSLARQIEELRER